MKVYVVLVGGWGESRIKRIFTTQADAALYADIQRDCGEVEEWDVDETMGEEYVRIESELHTSGGFCYSSRIAEIDLSENERNYRLFQNPYFNHPQLILAKTIPKSGHDPLDQSKQFRKLWVDVNAMMAKGKSIAEINERLSREGNDVE